MSPEIIRLAVTLYVRFPLSLWNVEELLHERREVNGDNYAPLGKTTQNDLRVAARYLWAYMNGDGDKEFLEDITPDAVAEFRGDYLMSDVSGYGPKRHLWLF